MNIKHSIRDAVTLLLIAALFTLPQSVLCQEDEAEPEVAVTVARVEKTTLRTYVTAYGTIETAPARPGAPPAGARIASPVSGIVSEVPCYEGLQVEKGAVICKLDSRIARAEVERAEQFLSLAEKTYQRQKQLEASNATSEKNFQAAEAELANARGDLKTARIALSLHRITAPFSGTITRLNVGPGESVDESTVVAEIADFTHLAAALRVPASEAGALKPGQIVQIKTENDDTPVNCTLSSLSPQVDPATDAVTVYAALPTDTPLQPGRFVSARIASGEHRDCLAVPETSVVKDEEAGWIIAVVKNGRGILMPVETGLRENGLVEVTADGLSEGMTVVKVGAYGLADETRVRVSENTETEAGQ